MKDQFNQSLGNLVDKLESWLNVIIKMVPNFVLALIVIFAFYILAGYASKLVGKLIERQVHKRAITNMVKKIIMVLVLIVGLFIALGILNLSKTVTSLLAGAGVIGLVVGFALQDSLSDTVSGIIISFRDKIRIGNWVETNGFAGEIVDINLKSFVMKEADNNIVLIPNKSILTNPLKNYSLTDKVRVTVACGVGYESDLESVRKLTQETLAKTFADADSADDIEFYYTEFGDSSINFITRFWTDGTNKKSVLAAHSQAMLAIKRAFDEQDINIPFPIRTLQFDDTLKMETESSDDAS